MQDKNPRVTRQDVAKRAGVSTATVSYVLNGLGDANNISQETQNRVKDAVAELNYVRNVSAQRLAAGKSKVIFIIADNMAVNFSINSTLHQIHQGVSDVCFKHGFNANVHGVYNNDWGSIREELVLSHRVDGLIIVNPPNNHHIIQELTDNNFPIVALGSARFPHKNSVNIDNFNAAKIATNHLITKGHQEIVHIPFSDLDLTDVAERVAGYKKAMADANLASNCIIRSAGYSFGKAFDVMNALLASDTPPTAVFAGNDIVAIGCMSAIWKKGLNIPEDIAIVGFDDIPVAAYLTPPLTTVRLDGQKQGELAANFLLDLVDGNTLPQNTALLESPLIVRDST
jgi:DNA-binding LacI/PurR family transcriptional regulator